MLKGKVANVTEAEANQPALRGSVRYTVSFSESGSAESDKTESAVAGSDSACSSKVRCDALFHMPRSRPCQQPGNVRFLEASHDASIHPCQPCNVRFLEASDEASIHPCQPVNVRFLEASDGASIHPASIHPCQPVNVRFLEASDWASIRPCHPGNVRFLEASDGASIHPFQPVNPVSRSFRWGEHPSLPTW